VQNTTRKGHGEVHQAVWHGCYRDGWQGVIHPAAFAHPAKYARTLIQRIYQHLRDAYGLAPGSWILDPFSGVSLGAMDALAMGYNVIHCELEPRFHALAKANLALWQQRYAHRPGYGQAVLLQGDSRHLRTVLAAAGMGAAACVVSSPPFCDSDGRKGGSDLYERRRRQTGRNPASPHTSAFTTGSPYGETPGNLGQLPPGALAAMVSSPPYAGNDKHDYRVTDDGGRDRDARRGKPQGHGCFRGSETYGQTPGNLGHLPTGKLSALVTSPPYADGLTQGGGQRDHTEHSGAGGAIVPRTYGSADGQLGNIQGDTFWSAAAIILRECVAVLADQGIACFVVKPYIRSGRIVDFPADWQRLCEAHGLRLIERIAASLVECHGIQEGLFGEEPTIVTTERKSFFRRLAEKKAGAPRIDSEIVFVFKKR
jgi:hypothetical protein